MIDDYWNKLLRKSCAYIFLEVIEGYADFTHVSNAITKTFEWSSCELSFDQYQSRTYIDLTYRGRSGSDAGINRYGQVAEIRDDGAGEPPGS